VIVLTRGLARAFRAVARTCVSGRPRGPAPAVGVETTADTLTVWTTVDGVGLVHTGPPPSPSAGGNGALVVPMDVLAAVKGPGDAAVELAVGPDRAGTARFTARGTPRTYPFAAAAPGPPPRPPAPPADWHPVPPAFPAALHECGRTAGGAGPRFALDHVQVRGTAGQVVGTDGRVALVWGGFTLPFAADLLVPAVPAFGTPALAGETIVRVGRTAGHLVVAAGPWRVHLPVDTKSRFPDVAGVVPRHAPTVAGIDARDAAALLAALPDLPGAGDEYQPVTLDLDRGVVVRAAAGAGDPARAVRLGRSPATGPPARVAVDRRALARALALGCVTVRATPGRPVVFAGGDKVLVVAALDPAPAAAPAAADTGVDAPPDSDPTPERRTAMKPHETPGPDRPARPDPPAGDAPDPLAEAEALRAALAEAAGRAARLVAALRHRRREKKALETAWTSLKALNLGP
jgi:hypothetical protein